jgi:hypothetical protein
MMADAPLWSLGQPAFSGGSGGNLVEVNDVRARYLAARRAADQGSYQLLLAFVRSQTGTAGDSEQPLVSCGVDSPPLLRICVRAGCNIKDIDGLQSTSSSLPWQIPQNGWLGRCHEDCATFCNFYL